MFPPAPGAELPLNGCFCAALSNHRVRSITARRARCPHCVCYGAPRIPGRPSPARSGALRSNSETLSCSCMRGTLFLWGHVPVGAHVAVRAHVAVLLLLAARHLILPVETDLRGVRSSHSLVAASLHRSRQGSCVEGVEGTLLASAVLGQPCRGGPVRRSCCPGVFPQRLTSLGTSFPFESSLECHPASAGGYRLLSRPRNAAARTVFKCQAIHVDHSDVRCTGSSAPI